MTKKKGLIVMGRTNARANESKNDEKILNETEGVTENVTGEETASTAETEASAGKIVPAEGAAPVANAEEKVTVVMPRFLFTSDVDVTHHDVVYAGKVYQVQYDVPHEVPKSVADIINNAIEQKKKVRGLIKSLSGKAKEISNE